MKEYDWDQAKIDITNKLTIIDLMIEKDYRIKNNEIKDKKRKQLLKKKLNRLF